MSHSTNVCAVLQMYYDAIINPCIYIDTHSLPAWMFRGKYILTLDHVFPVETFQYFR
jgi:hypothetical protein